MHSRRRDVSSTGVSERREEDQGKHSQDGVWDVTAPMVGERKDIVQGSGVVDESCKVFYGHFEVRRGHIVASCPGDTKLHGEFFHGVQIGVLQGDRGSTEPVFLKLLLGIGNGARSGVLVGDDALEFADFVFNGKNNLSEATEFVSICKICVNWNASAVARSCVCTGRRTENLDCSSLRVQLPGCVGGRDFEFPHVSMRFGWSGSYYIASVCQDVADFCTKCRILDDLLVVLEV